jgi:nicotinate-nucleotide pyrophosphorylase (carboxylating)
VTGHGVGPEVDINCAGGVDVTLCKTAIAMIEGRAQTEVSGNVTLDTVGEIAKCGCDFVSCGALTHSVQAMDISFNIDVEQPAPR